MEEMNLEEMRSQFAILKEQLDKQEIVSDRLFRETIKTKNKDINFVKKSGYWLVPIVILLYLPLYIYPCSKSGFHHCYLHYVMGGMVSTYYVHKPVDKLNFMDDDLASVARVMAKFKKQQTKGLYMSFAILIPWAAWACYELAWKNGPMGINPWILTASMAFGGIIGGIIGISIYRKVINVAQDIIDEIEKNE
jgi:hypothetical protein